MKFRNWEQFSKRFPDLARVIEKNSNNTFCRDMRERIEEGKDISTKQRKALEGFLEALVRFRKHDEIELPVDLTAREDEKGVRWRCPELRLNGRFTWDLYEEVFPADVRHNVESGVRVAVIVKATIEWVADDGGFVIANATDVEPLNRESEKQKIIDLIAEARGEWPTPGHLRKKKERNHRSGHSSLTRGVYYFRALKFIGDGSSKFWNIVVELIKPKGGGSTHFRVFRHYGRIGSRGNTQADTYDSYLDAVEAADEMALKKLDKGYWVDADDDAPHSFGAVFASELEAQDEKAEDAWYDAGRKRVITPVGEFDGLGSGPDPDEEYDRSQEPSPDPDFTPAVTGPVVPPTRRQALLPSFSNWQSAFDD